MSIDTEVNQGRGSDSGDWSFTYIYGEPICVSKLAKLSSKENSFMCEKEC